MWQIWLLVNGGVTIRNLIGSLLLGVRLYGNDLDVPLVTPDGTAYRLEVHTVSGLVACLLTWKVAAGADGSIRMLILVNVVLKLCATSACIPRVDLQQVLQQFESSVHALTTTWCPVLLLNFWLWARPTILLILCALLLLICSLQCTVLQWVRPESILSGTTRQHVLRVH